MRSHCGISPTRVGVPPDARAATTRENGGDEEERRWLPRSPPACMRPATGTRSPTAACSATSAPATAACARASAASASCARAAGDAVVLTTYGRSSGFCVDPIEKKPLNHFLPGTAGALVRDGRLQPRLQVLPELGHLQVARDGHAGRRRLARGARGRGRAARLPERRLHLQRPGHLPRVRRRHGDGLPGARDQDGGRDRRVRLPRAARRALRATWTPRTST